MANDSNIFVGSNSFFSISSRNRPNPKQKSAGYTKSHTNEPFEPFNDDTEIKDLPLMRQIRNTVSSVYDKTLKAPDEIFYVVHSKITASDSDVESVLTKLDCDIIDYLNKDHSTVLVRGSNVELTKISAKTDLPKILTNNIYSIRTLEPDDQIPNNVKQELFEQEKMIIISIMPNNNEERHKRYLNILKNFLTKKNLKLYEEELETEGLIFTETNLDVVKELLNDSTFIHFVELVPDAIAQKIKKKNSKSNSKIKSTASSFVKSKKKLPFVVVLDSGVNEIPQLNGLIESRDSDGYLTPDDKFEVDGHGTPIASLMCLGENLDSPVSKIISYKIFGSKIKNEPFAGLMKGIKKYSKLKKRLFLTSINYSDVSQKLESKLDKLIQRENICLVSSAGNITGPEILGELSTNNYPDYIEKYPIQAPANAVSVIGVGSIAKKIFDNGLVKSIAPLDGISPFSRGCSNNVFLYDCPKPEIVEFGSNLNIEKNQLNYENVGLSSFNRNGKLISNCFGTSFSAPFFARKLSELENSYGHLINNAETLKALAFSTCLPISSPYTGLGYPQRVLGCDNNHALYFTEGEIQLRGKSTKQYYEDPFSEFVVKVPSSTGRIDLFIVHSDNFSRTTLPTLNTYLKVDVWKTASESKVDPKNIAELSRITNVKHLFYSFDIHNMEGKWTFQLHPALSAKIASRYKHEIKVRYGCVVLLSRKESRNKAISMNDEINMM